MIASTAAPMLAAELAAQLAHPASRTTLASMYNTLWYLRVSKKPTIRWRYNSCRFIRVNHTARTIYGICHINSGWYRNLPTALQALPAIANLVGLFFLPGSPRWLVGQDHHEQANSIFIKYHARGDESSQFVAAESEEIRAALQLEMAGTRS